MLEEESSLDNSMAKKSQKSYKSRSIDRDEAEDKYLKNSSEKRMVNSREKNNSREKEDEQEDALDIYYKQNRNSPSGHSNRSKKSRSKSR